MKGREPSRDCPAYEDQTGAGGVTENPSERYLVAECTRETSGVASEIKHLGEAFASAGMDQCALRFPWGWGDGGEETGRKVRELRREEKTVR